MVNLLYGRQIYPSLAGETPADLATGPLAPTGVTTRATSEVEQALTIGGQANPVVGLLVFGALTAGIMYVAHRLGEPEDFRNLRASAYNVMLISLIAVAGIPVWKYVFTRWKVPGVSAWVAAV